MGEEEIKVRLAADGHILEMNKTMPVEAAVGESIGIERFSADWVRHLFTVLERMITVEERVNIFYEVAFEEVIAEGGTLFPIDISAWPCMELDTVEDFHAAERSILPGLS